MNLAYNFWTVSARALIFHISISSNRTFQGKPSILNLWPWPWSLAGLLFSLPEPKAQVSSSDQDLSLVRHHRYHYCCCKLFTFSSSSPEPLGQFHLYLAQSILGMRGLKFVQMKGPALFQWEIITKSPKYIEVCLNGKATPFYMGT